MIGACQMADNALPKTLTVTQALHAGRCATVRGSAPRPLLRRAQKAQIKPRLYPLLDERRGSGQRCASPSHRTWWESSRHYDAQGHIRSFQNTANNCASYDAYHRATGHGLSLLATWISG